MWRWFPVVLWGLVMFCSCGGADKTSRLHALADSLNERAYGLRYKDLGASSQMALQAYRMTGGYPGGRAESLNNLAFCAFMQMDFERSAELYEKAFLSSKNEIERLVADVGMMKICQRTSMNKEFYDYRNSALRRMKRIDEDRFSLKGSRLQKRLDYAVSEFYIVSGIYYYYLQQEKESLEAIDAVPEEILRGDSAQWLYYLYMRGSGGMYKASSQDEITLGELSCLLECLQASHVGGYVYFEANAMQGIAELLNTRSNRDLVKEERPGLLRLLNPDNVSLDSLPLRYARNALCLFKQYGDWYQISGTYRTLATYYNHADEPEKALDYLAKALDYVNLHHEKYYHCTDTLDRLRTFIPDEPVSIELAWINDQGIKTIPEWIARLREQLSLTYSAMGCKRESDYNRNIYLDILDYTRQDKELESRYQALEQESGQLNILLWMVIIGLVVLATLFVGLSFYRKRRNAVYVDRLKQTLSLCRKITGSVPVDASDAGEVKDAVLQAVEEDILRQFRADELDIRLDGEECPEEKAGGRHVCSFALISPGGKKPVGWLYLSRSSRLRKDELVFVRLLLPYLAWTLENGMNFVSFDDERRRVEKEFYIHARHLSEYKCQNEVKKTCLSLVTDMLPYIDRMANEIHKLRSFPYAQKDEVRRSKLGYIRELVTRINEYNDILASWIRMRQGEVSLNIENFGLDELFSVIAKGKHAFDTKHQKLLIRPTRALVRADKALTLFMVNTLTENARKYTQEGGCIEVRAEEKDGCVEISVSDNGPGLSPEDISLILDNKIYDSAKIGMVGASDTYRLQKRKGHGFGLMNCKGIIEKYRKTNPIFSVCSFNIESRKGEGSRFYFRLPKGVRKVVGVLCLFAWVGMSCSPGDAPQKAVSDGHDSLLIKANDYANIVYDCNVDGAYQEALLFADSVLYYMNAHYRRCSGCETPLLSLCGEGDAAEQEWFSKGFGTDYYILLDVRNEAAVAALALKDFRIYHYNNDAYATLYKRLGKDTSLEEYCIQMQQSANNKWIALVVFVLLVMGCLMAYYVFYIRRRLHYRYNMEQVFAINEAVFSASPHWGTEGEIAVPVDFLNKFFEEMKELVPIDDLGLAIYDEDTRELKNIFYADRKDDSLSAAVRRCFDERKPQWEEADGWDLCPLWVESGDKKLPVGVFAMHLVHPLTREEDRLAVELVLGYLSVVLYHTIVQVKRKYGDIELMQDNARRTEFEENQLHVQNLVLDNCLSTIKHETVYYPNRIRQIVDSIDRTSDAEIRKRLDIMAELVSYYKDVFTLLTSCAARQLDEITFRRTGVSVQNVMDYAARYLKKLLRKQRFTLDLEIRPAALSVAGDEVLLHFLMENLLDEAVRHAESGRLTLAACRDGDFVRFDFTDFRRVYAPDELNALFYPDKARICMGENGGVFSGTEYLVCKQIVREHDEFSGRRGCRINASPVDGGFKVWFTIPVWK